MKHIYTVGQVNSYIKNMFTQDFLLQSILVKGEVSNCKYHSSGHLYFTLKDERGAIACVMFAGNRGGLKFHMQEGQQVVVTGTVDVYERDGKYQLYAREIALDGAGLLYERYERLKQKLLEQGLFAPEYKRPIPRFIRRLGVVTAPTGAAVRDIINIASRRNPYVQIVLYPAIVQGDQAPASIVNGIRALERLGVDAMIVGRGGGSIEDLWAFNEEIVAQAIFDCSVPVISAVGHETDTTIADYVADLRAPTPSAAAELAVYDYSLLQAQLDEAGAGLVRRMKQKLALQRMRMETCRIRLQHLSPLGRIREKRTWLAQLSDRLSRGMEDRIDGRRHQLALCAERLNGLSPLQKLSQGFSHVADGEGRTVTDIGTVRIGDLLTIHMKNGRVTAQVKEKEAWQWKKES
ncbi:MAG TPA: exodeoxyribonuclease VII large subunit [Candidatus Eisenbergiella merdigallinarum]|uniref:Exodeoxyribonuclease 7 large subunit n=1 Tax=Candidatus Eisenbergiella merdigallinarum TaxID=2838552 RepID=A0A9D2SDD1_9FIRM|nr:exodeoxyribonuclease VII large subunit [Candidatus Eisenbergiella merdigallinarum]